MRKAEASVTMIVGVRGCGKSTLTNLLASQSDYDRKIVFDPMSEWNSPLTVHSFEEFSEIWKKHFDDPNFTIVVRFGFGASREQISGITDQIVRTLYYTGQHLDRATALIFEEAQFFFPQSYTTPTMDSLITTGRHARLSVIANTQRPANVSKNLISQADRLFVGRLYEKNDLVYLYASIGEEALYAKNLENLEFILYEKGSSVLVDLRKHKGKK